MAHTFGIRTVLARVMQPPSFGHSFGEKKRELLELYPRLLFPQLYCLALITVSCDNVDTSCCGKAAAEMNSLLCHYPHLAPTYLCAAFNLGWRMWVSWWYTECERKLAAPTGTTHASFVGKVCKGGNKTWILWWLLWLLPKNSGRNGTRDNLGPGLLWTRASATLQYGAFGHNVEIRRCNAKAITCAAVLSVQTGQKG